MRRVALILVLALAACGTTDKLVHATAPAEGAQGIRVEIEGGGFTQNASARLENVGTYTSVPAGWKGPVPPDWQIRTEGESIVLPGEP